MALEGKEKMLDGADFNFLGRSVSIVVQLIQLYIHSFLFSLLYKLLPE
jgi:hypothetical protein